MARVLTAKPPKPDSAVGLAKTHFFAKKRVYEAPGLYWARVRYNNELTNVTQLSHYETTTGYTEKTFATIIIIFPSSQIKLTRKVYP